MPALTTTAPIALVINKQTARSFFKVKGNFFFVFFTIQSVLFSLYSTHFQAGRQAGILQPIDKLSAIKLSVARRREQQANRFLLLLLLR